MPLRHQFVAAAFGDERIAGALQSPCSPQTLEAVGDSGGGLSNKSKNGAARGLRRKMGAAGSGRGTRAGRGAANPVGDSGGGIGLASTSLFRPCR